MMYTRGRLEGRDRDDGMYADSARAEVVSQGRNGGAAGIGRRAIKITHSLAQATRTFASAVVRAHQRNAAIRELQALDDWLLKDIGIHRSQIPYLVEERLSREREEKAASAKLRDVDDVPDRQPRAARPRECLGPAA